MNNSTYKTATAAHLIPEMGDHLSVDFFADNRLQTITGRVSSINAGQLTIVDEQGHNPCRIEQATIKGMRLH
ncbi:yolD-like protein [Caudoviricetes sp.]|nr:yolD-like protein [Caudoviricetes sp.]